MLKIDKSYPLIGVICGFLSGYLTVFLLGDATEITFLSSLLPGLLFSISILLAFRLNTSLKAVLLFLLCNIIAYIVAYFLVYYMIYSMELNGYGVLASQDSRPFSDLIHNIINILIFSLGGYIAGFIVSFGVSKIIDQISRNETLSIRVTSLIASSIGATSSYFGYVPLFVLWQGAMMALIGYIIYKHSKTEIQLN